MWGMGQTIEVDHQVGESFRRSTGQCARMLRGGKASGKHKKTGRKASNRQVATFHPFLDISQKHCGGIKK